MLQNINLLVFLINKSKQTVYGEERNQASQKHKTNFWTTRRILLETEKSSKEWIISVIIIIVMVIEIKTCH